MIVCIDPGHGPGDPNGGPTGYREHVGMWALSNHLKNALGRCGITVILTRQQNQNVTLTNRGNMARGCNVFISQHSNAANGRARGTEVFFSLQRPNNRPWAARISAEIAKLFNHPDRGAKTRPATNNPRQDFYTVINRAVAVGCPNVFLVESGFHDNLQDEAFLKQDSNLKLIAEAQARVICELLKVQYVEEVAEVPMGKVYLDGKLIGECVLHDGRSWLPVRALEGKRYKVDRWDGNTKSVYLVSVE